MWVDERERLTNEREREKERREGNEQLRDEERTNENRSEDDGREIKCGRVCERNHLIIRSVGID